MSENGRLSGTLPNDHLLSCGDGVTGGAKVFIRIRVCSDLCSNISEANGQNVLDRFYGLNHGGRVWCVLRESISVY